VICQPPAQRYLMPPVALKILFVGDMHLGRRPARLPPGLAARADALGPAGAWRRTVDLAIVERVEAVALAGDLVEREDDFFEAYRELHDGVVRLTAAGIRVLGVTGNHDVQVLPRLADQLEGFRLLGRGGRWESLTLGEGASQATIWGWSFPARHVEHSPLAGQRFERGAGVNLGLLHCDRDQPRSRYAPVRSAELSDAGLDGWLLGHIHAPDALAAPRPSGYLGSLTGLDPGEPGARGPWLLSIEGGRVAEAAQQVLAPLRWEPLALELGGIERPEQAQDRLLEALQSLDTRLAALARPPEAVGLRVTLVGRSRHGTAAERLLGGELRAGVPVGGSRIHYFIEHLASLTRPELELEALAARQDPLGLLARRLAVLDADPDAPGRQELIEAARARLADVAAQARWQALDLPPLDDEAVAGWLRQAAARLLEQMLAQQDSAA
jgi:DNA repair protein SbcD/Mre11